MEVKKNKKIYSKNTKGERKMKRDIKSKMEER